MQNFAVDGEKNGRLKGVIREASRREIERGAFVGNVFC